MSMVMPVMKVLFNRHPDPVPFNEIVSLCRNDAEGVKEALNWMKIYFFAMRVMENCWLITEQGQEYYQSEWPLDIG